MKNIKYIYANVAKQLVATIMLLFVLSLGYSQTKKVSGIVINASSNRAIVGATISAGLIGPSVQSLGQGEFQFIVRDTTAYIFVHHIGFETVRLDIRQISPYQELKISLTPNHAMLEEVTVNTGYQSLPKERATGSYSTIDNKLLNQRLSTSIIGRLEGMAPGLLFSPSPAPPMTVRGINSISSGKEPLIVVDNFPYQGNIENINPNDVLNVTILKDAAAASIWGARAGNGVIVITTKKGQLNQPLRISATMNGTYLAKPDVYSIKNISSADFIEVEKMLFDKGFYQPMEVDPIHPPFTPVVELLIKRRDGLVSQDEVDKKLAYFAKQNILDDFDRYWYSSGWNQQYNINMNGGSKQLAWLFSLGYDKNSSNLQDKSDRLTMRINNQYQIVNQLKLTTEVVATQNRLTAGRQPYRDATLINNGQKYLYPYAKLVGDDGVALPLINHFRSTYVDTAGNGHLEDWRYYPFAERDANSNKTTAIDLLTNLALRYDLSKSIRLEARYQYEKQQSNTAFNQLPSSYFARYMINSYAQDLGGGNWQFPVPKGGILDDKIETLESNSFRLQTDLSHVWGKHSLFGVAGFEAGLTKIRSNAYRTFGYKQENNNFVEIDYATLFPQYFYPAVRLPIFSGRYISGTNNGRVSYYVNGSYDYDKKYILTFSARKDQSNLFGSRTNERTVPLWSAGVSWNVLEERFIRIPELSLLKLRLTYGYNGNMNPNSSAITIIYHYPGTGELPPYSYIGSFPNANLRWEKVRNLNLGLDFISRNNRLSGRLEIFRKKITDLSTTVPIDYTAGFQTVPMNAATMYGKGVELELSGNIGNKAFQYVPTLMLSFISNKISEDYLAHNSRVSSYVGGSGVTTIPGKSPYSVLSYRFAGLNPDNGNPIGILKGEQTEKYSEITSKSTLDDIVYHGSSIPTVFGSFRNSFVWKNFNLAIQILYKGKYYFRKPTILYGSLYGASLGHTDFSLRWQKAGDENSTTVPSMQFPLQDSQRDSFYRYSEATIEKGDHVRLQDINLSYSFSKTMFGKVYALQLYTVANNLGIIWRANKKDIDPDYIKEIGQPYNLSLGVKANF